MSLKEQRRSDQHPVTEIALTAGDRAIQIGQAFGSVIIGHAGDEVHRRDLLILLDRVRDFWIEGVFKKSVYSEALIELGILEQPEAVERPWELILKTPGQQERPIPTGKKIIEIFDEMGRALLILGEPGSGKTITLLELARDAIARAETDPTQPIPVVFNLSSWAERRGSLADWLVDELNTKYQIPRKTGRKWIEMGDLVLLLDGLDEVKQAHQVACAEAINQFRREHGLVGIAVCSRAAEYRSLGVLLKLQAATMLQPLTRQQIDDYLAATGPNLAALRAELQHDATLQELAQSPLMLSVMGFAYQDISTDLLAVGQLDSAEDRRRHLFDSYVDQMFKRRREGSDYTPKQTVDWLSWLAQRMAQHNSSIFLIENMQPSWLPTRAQLWLYVMGSRILGVLGIGLPWVVAIGLVSSGVSLFLLGLLLPLLLATGTAVGLIDGIRFKRYSEGFDSHATSYTPSFWRRIANVLIVSFSASLIWAVSCSALDPSLSALWLMVALLFGLPCGLIFGLRGAWQRVERDIKTAENLSWSWRALLTVLAFGILTGGVTFLITSVLYDPGVKLWDADGNLVSTLSGIGPVASASFSPDGTRMIVNARGMTISDRGPVLLWDADGRFLSTLDGYGNRTLASFIWFPNDPDPVGPLWDTNGKRIVTASADGMVRLWDADGNSLASFKAHEGQVLSASFSPDGARIVTTGCDDIIDSGDAYGWRCAPFTARLWDADGTYLNELEGYKEVVLANFSPDGTRILTTGCDDVIDSQDGSGWSCATITARLWDADGTYLNELEGYKDLDLTGFSPDGKRIVTASAGGMVRLWDANGNSLASFKAYSGQVLSASFSPDRARIVTTGCQHLNEGGFCAADTVRLWDADGNSLASFKAHKGQVLSANFSPDGTRILTTGCDDVIDSQDGSGWSCATITARLWDADGTYLNELEVYKDLDLTGFSPDGKRIVTASADGMVRLWDADGNSLASFKAHKGQVLSASFSPDGARIVTTSLGVDARWIAVLWLAPSLLLGLFAGLRTSVRQAKTSPNQGIWLTARNSIIIGLILGLIGALLVALTLEMSDPSPGDPISVEDILTSLPWLLGTVGVLAALPFGGLDVVQHFVLRIVLYLKGYIPWNYAQFLDYAAERIFLRKVGGGYIFIHRLLMEYFMELDAA